MSEKNSFGFIPPDPSGRNHAECFESFIKNIHAIDRGDKYVPLPEYEAKLVTDGPLTTVAVELVKDSHLDVSFEDKSRVERKVGLLLGTIRHLEHMEDARCFTEYRNGEAFFDTFLNPHSGRPRPSGELNQYTANLLQLMNWLTERTNRDLICIALQKLNDAGYDASASCYNGMGSLIIRTRIGMIVNNAKVL